MNIKDKLRVFVRGIIELPLSEKGEKRYVLQISLCADTLKWTSFTYGSLPFDTLAGVENKADLEVILSEKEYQEFVRTHENGIWRSLSELKNQRVSSSWKKEKRIKYDV